MRESRAWSAVRELAPLPLSLLGIALRNELATTAALLVLIAVAFAIRYHRREGWLLLAGALFGLVFEIGGDVAWDLQSWKEGSLWGIPYWLPILWGIGFVFIHRFGDLVLARRVAE